MDDSFQFRVRSFEPFGPANDYNNGWKVPLHTSELTLASQVHPTLYFVKLNLARYPGDFEIRKV